MTIVEIAKLSGVSPATVSRVLNKLPGVRPKTRERVLSIVREREQETAPRSAQTVLSGHNQVLGLVLHQNFVQLFGNTAYALMLQGIQHAARQRGYEIFLWLGENTEHHFFERIVCRRMVDGVLMLNASDSSTWLTEQLVSARFPCVVIGQPTHEEASYVDVDNRRAAQEAVEHLIRLGRKRVGIVTGSAQFTASQERLAGYQDALRKMGVRFDPALVTEGHFTEEGAYHATGMLLEANPDAIFVGSDTMALGVLQRLEAENISVPDQIAITSYDDLPLASTSKPALTTVRQPLEAMGRVATSLLLDIIQQRNASPRRILLPTRLIMRESCGAGM